MQQIEGYPTDLGVSTPTALVVVNGVEQEVESLTVSRELASTLPAQVNSVSGITAATGSVSWAVGGDVQKRPAHPWDGNNFPPKPTDDVVAFMGYGDTMVRQLTGSVDDSQGSIASGEISSGLVDRIDKLNRPVSFPAFLSTMPPRDENGDIYRVGLEPTFITDRILRECGFYATPPRSTNCVFSAPMMGSSWPERGTVVSSQRQDRVDRSPTFAATQWGVGLTSCDAVYTPQLSVVGGDGRLNRTMQITLKADFNQGTSGQSFVRVFWGSNHITLSITEGRDVLAIRRNNDSFMVVRSFSAATVADADVFTLRVDEDGRYTLLANNGESTSSTVPHPAVFKDTHISSVWVYTPHETGVRIGGAQVNFATTSIFNAEQTAQLSPSTFGATMPAFPRVQGRNALAVLKEQADAECAAMWIDERGVFRWKNRRELTLASSSAFVTALDDVLDVGWESSASGVREKVIVLSREALVSLSTVSNQVAWQGNGSSLEASQVKEDFATPESDTDWVEVDEFLRTLPSVPGALTSFNLGRGTWGGGIASNGDGSQWATVNNSSFSVVLEKITDSAYKITTDAGSPPSGRTIELRTPGEDSSSAVWQSKRNFDLPVLRSKAIIQWMDIETTGVNPGPPNAAVLEHDVGAWVQNADALQELADWLSAQVFEPKPVLRNLSVIPDFRRQLGDVVWVEGGDEMRIRIKVLITKLDTTVSAGSAEQTIGGRIIEVQSYGATNAQLDAHSSSRTNAGFDTLWSDATNAQLDTDPLGRG